MKKIYLLLSLLFSVFSMTAQTTIQGKIADEKNQPIPFSSVALIAAKDSHLIKGALTDEQGAFSIPSVSAGFYRILSSSVGFDKQYSEAFTVKEDSKMATVDVTLKTASKLLDEAVITAARPLFEQKADRLVMNVALSPIAAGGTAMEILQKVPGVILIQDRVTLGGSQNVQIYVDGKPSQYADMNAVLRDMPGDQIDRIELIKQPGAQFDAAGGPILNIILKRNAELGLTGTASMTLGGSAYDQSDVKAGNKTYYRLSPSLSMNYRSGMWNMYGSYSYSNRKVFNIQKVDRFIVNEIYQSYNYEELPVDFQNFRFGTDFYATKKTTFGILLRGWQRNSLGDARNITDVFNADKTQNLNSFVTDNLTKSERSNLAGNFNVKHEFDSKTGHSLNFDVDYATFETKNSSNLNIYKNELGSLQSKSRQDLDQPVNILVTKLDYSYPIDSTLKADIGVKSSFNNVDNNLNFYRAGERQANQSNDFIYRENINAGYLNLSKKVGSIDLNVGLRVEQTVVNGKTSGQTILDRNYTGWFPSASALLHMDKLFKGLGVQLSYSKRINRPGFQQQNPFSFFIDSLTFQKGNPTLNPETQHMAQFGFVFDGQPVLNVSYTRTDDVIINNAPLLEGTKTFTVAQNLATKDSWTIQLNGPLKLGKFLDGYIGNQFIYNAYNADYRGFKYDVSRWHYLAYAGGNLKLPNDIKLEFNAFYMTKFLDEFFTIGNIGSFSFGASKTFMDKRARLSVNFNDVFYSQNASGIVDFQNVKVNFQQRGDSRNARLTFSYQFGNTKVKNTRKRSTASESETSRIKVE